MRSLSGGGFPWRGSRRQHHGAAGEPRLDEADVAALYLILMARLPEGEAIYTGNRGRPTAQLIADMLRSPEFRERILPALLAQGALPHERLDHADLDCARAWLEKAGLGTLGPSSGWSSIVAIVLTEEPARGLLPQALPEHAARLAQAAAEIRRTAQPARSALDDPDINALHLLLLGRMPDGVGAYRAHKGRPRDDVIADIFASPTFRDRVLLPLLLDLPLPQRRLGADELGFLRAWLTGIGLPPAGIEEDGLDLFAAMLLAAPVARLAAATLPPYADRIRAKAMGLRLRACARLPMTHADVEALYLLLVGRRPEDERVYRDRTGRRRDQAIADILGSGEFRDNVVIPFLSGGRLPQERLSGIELVRVKVWVEAGGPPLPPAASDWVGVFARFLSQEPAASLLPQMVPAFADRLAQRVARELARSAEERADAAKAGEAAGRLDALDQRLKALETGWRQHVPAFLNAVSSVGAFAHEQARLARDIEALRQSLGSAKKAAD